MAKNFEAIRIEIDEYSVHRWQEKIPDRPCFVIDKFIEEAVTILAEKEYKKPYKVEISRNHLMWSIYADVYFDFVAEKEKFKFRLAGKGEELQKKISQRIMNTEYLKPIKVLNCPTL